jgi:Domain of unknown function (DUF4124)
MERRILLLLIVGLLSVTSVGAETFSCRDSKGELHFADSPARLPDECQGKTQELKSDKLDKLNIVPATPVPQESGSDFEETVRAAEDARQQRQQQILQLQQRAEKLAKSYQDAVSAKRQALRSWSYSSREEINKADQQMANAREEKQLLIKELETLRMSPEDQQKIKQSLDSIEAE